MFDLRPPDPGGLYQHVSYNQSENEDSMPPKMRKRWMHRELESLRELNGNTSPSSSQGSNHSHVVRLSESPGSSSSTSAVSLGSPTITPSKLTKEPGFGISNGYGHGMFLYLSFRMFHWTFVSGVDRPQCENDRQENHERHHWADDALSNSHHQHPASMPPPPMPAYLDPTTISSTKPSISSNHYFESPFATPILPSVSPLTSFANLSLLSPALLRSTPPPSLLAPFARPPANPGMSTTPTVPPSTDKNTAAWSPLRRHTAVSPPPSLPVPVSLSSHHDDTASIAPSSSSPSSLTTIPANDVNDQPDEFPSCTPSPPPSPFSLQPETLPMDTNNEIQSTPHSPDPMWRADSPSGDHVSPSIELNTPAHILNHDDLSESQLEESLMGSEEVQRGTSMDEDGHRESPVLDVNGGDHMDVGVSSSYSLRVPQDDTPMVMDHCSGDEEGNHLTGTPDYMSDSNRGRSPARLRSPTLNDDHSSKPSISLPPLQPLLLDSVSLSTSQHNPAAAYQPAVKEEELRTEDSREQPSHPPAPKVKMSLRDFALRKKKQREEEMTKNVQDTPSSAGVDLQFGSSEGGGSPNGIQANPMGQVDEESRNGKTVELKGDLVNLYQGASTLSRNMVKNEVIDVPGPSSIKPINGVYHPQPSSSPSPDPLSTLLVARMQADTSATYPIATHLSKPEPIEQPMQTPLTIQPRMMDSRRYAASYNHSGSISPINHDPHHFQSYSPPQPCQEDGEIGEILDTPLQLPSSSPAVTPAMNRLASMATGSITPLPRGPTSKRADFAFTRSASSLQVPPTHPRSFNASPPYRQQPPSASTPPPLPRGTGVPPTAPRALRQYMSSNRPTPNTTPTVTSSSSSYPSSTSSSTSNIPTSSTTITTTTGGRFPPYIPRGPSADRDKVRDIDQTQYARSHSRRNSREGHAWGR